MLELVDPLCEMAIVELNKNIFHALIGPDGMIFLCLCDEFVLSNYRQSFLEDLCIKWQRKYGNDAASFAPGSKNNDFGEIYIRNLLDEYNNEENNNK